MPETKKTTSVKPKQVAAVKKKSVKTPTPAKESKWSTKLIRQGLVPTLSNYFFGPAGAIVSGLTPFNARQAMAAFITGDSNFSLKDAPEGVQRALYQSIAKANSNNKDKTKGEFRGTQYKDYSPEMEDVLQNLKGSIPSVLKGSLLSDDFNAATTFGRVSYKDNPETNSYDVYDNYDFTTTDNVSSPYARIRNMVGDLAKGTPLDPTNKGKSNYIGSFNKGDWNKKSEGLLDVPFSKIQKALSSDSKKAATKKQDGGWLSKYDVPEADNGIEGTMGGLTDQGFNYNGAWGGTMQMGGSLPGAVGFSYARTQSPAPNNGKYAKKTKASAQNGQEMKYYQEGLDWKPKTISRDGSSLPQAQGGFTVPNWASDLSTRVSNAVSTFGGSAIGDAVKGVSPQAAEYLNEYSAGFIPYTTDEQLMATRSGNPDRGMNTALQASDAVSNVLAGKLIGPLLGSAKSAVSKGVGKVSKATGTFAKDFMQGYKPMPVRKEGGVIEDDRGQWEHPGEITKINSNQITMQGVDYPVLGISDSGDTQMMQPGQDYTYEGESVTEYPMMKDGGSTSSTITCPNCGWTWKKSEAGNDPYVCHKCGFNNASKIQNSKKENGGWLNKYN